MSEPPALVSWKALEEASLRDLAVAVLVGGIAPQADSPRLTDDDIKDQVGRAVKGAGDDSDPPGDRSTWILEGMQTLEHSSLIRITRMDSSYVVFLTRRGRRAIDAGDPSGFMIVPDEQGPG